MEDWKGHKFLRYFSSLAIRHLPVFPTQYLRLEAAVVCFGYAVLEGEGDPCWATECLGFKAQGLVVFAK